MKAMISVNTLLIATFALFAAGCQSETSNVATANGQENSRNNSSGHSNMNGHDMSNMDHGTSAENAANQPYDLQFIDSMIHHHEGAISMSEMALTKATRPELKSFAQKIIEDQKAEISKMKAWREEWYRGKTSALNMEMPGMKMGKMMDEAHTKEMGAMQGKAFDLHFIDMMVPHHEGAVEMAKLAIQKAEHKEIKDLAQKSIDAQQGEIKKMQAWKSDWSK